MRRQRARRHREQNSHKENALCGNKKCEIQKYTCTGGVRRERAREPYESETNNKTQKAWETLIIHTYFKSRCCAPVYRSENKKKYLRLSFAFFSSCKSNMENRRKRKKLEAKF